MSYCVSSIILLFIIANVNVVHGIVGGNITEHADYPFIASLQWDKLHKCGGVLVRSDLVLTVAHCIPLVYVNKTERHRASVLIGTGNQKNPDIGSRRVPISHIEFHNKVLFNFSTITMEKLKTLALNEFPDDYALLKLAERVQETPFIRIARLAPKAMPARSTVCTILGWGRFHFPDLFLKWENNFSTFLRRGKMMISHDYRLPKTMMTICPIKNGATGWLGSPCFGDSGSPVICEDSNNKPYVAGLIEAAKLPCDTKTACAVAMRVDVIREWINEFSNRSEFTQTTLLLNVLFILCALSSIALFGS